MKWFWIIFSCLITPGAIFGWALSVTHWVGWHRKSWDIIKQICFVCCTQKYIFHQRNYYSNSALTIIISFSDAGHKSMLIHLLWPKGNTFPGICINVTGTTPLGPITHNRLHRALRLCIIPQPLLQWEQY